MPYIKQDCREQYDKHLVNLPIISSKGELEYIVFSLMKQYMSTRNETYSDLHDCTYAVQHCADEFRRRFLDDRENIARENNGDIL